MRTIQKTLLVAAVVVVSGASVYEGRQVSCLQREARAIQQQHAPVKEHIQRLRQERDEATHRLAALTEENVRWQANSNELFQLRSEILLLRRDAEQLKALRRLQSTDPQAAGTVAWLDRVQRLKVRLAQNPEARIPEMASLTERDWLSVTATELKSDTNYRSALSALRTMARAHYLDSLHDAIEEFTKGNDGKWPTDLAQVKAYLNMPIEEAILQRYEIVPADTLPTLNPISGMVLTDKASSVVDPEFDYRVMVGSEAGSMLRFKESELLTPLIPAIRAYLAANNGQMPEDADPAKFTPYVRTAEEQAALASATREYESASPAMRALTLKIIKNLKPK